jgi:hypothetical protein
MKNNRGCVIFLMHSMSYIPINFSSYESLHPSRNFGTVNVVNHGK